MIYPVLSFGVFIITAVFHFLVFRLNTRRRSIPAAFVIFLAGFLLELFTVFNISSVLSAGVIPLPFSGIAFYMLLSTAYLIYLSPIILSDSSPSNTIIEMILSEGKAFRERLIKKFNSRDYIGKRLAEMVRTGLIRKNKNRYKIAAKGAKVAKLFIFYRDLYKWDRGG